MKISSWSPHLLSVLRIMTALMFVEHGSSKMFGFPAPAHGAFELFTLGGFSALLELVGGIFLALGLFTRPTAFILSGEMAVAYFMVHAPKGFYPLASGGNGGELAVLYCFVFLYLFAAGPGPWSIDALRRRA
jgi:putative oxidoreductase